MTERPLTVAQVADRWDCSIDAVYAAIRKGDLQAFRVGGKLLRIKPEEIERWENVGANTRSETTGSDSSKDKPPSAGPTQPGITAEGLVSAFLK